MKELLEITRSQLQSAENSVLSCSLLSRVSRVDSNSITQELKKELVNCQIALADSRNEKNELANELKRLHETFASCNNAEYTRVREMRIVERRTASSRF